jgi:hypothetical protein
MAHPIQRAHRLELADGLILGKDNRHYRARAPRGAGGTQCQRHRVIVSSVPPQGVSHDRQVTGGMIFTEC